MPRNAENSRWYLPLFAGTDITDRADPALVTIPSGTITGNLPDLPPWVLPGLYLWYDAAQLDSIQEDGDGGVMRWRDRSGGSRDATQETNALRPAVETGGEFAPRAIRI